MPEQFGKSEQLPTDWVPLDEYNRLQSINFNFSGVMSAARGC